MPRPWRRMLNAGALFLALLVLTVRPSAGQTPEAIQAMLDQGRLNEALEAATRLTDSAPADCNGWRLLGDAHRKLTRVDRAAAAYRKGLEACASDKELLRALGSMLEESEQYDEAARVLGSLWALDSSDPEIGSRLGAACYRAGRCAEGRKAYETLLAAHPDRVTDRLAYAQLLGRTCKDFPAAQAEFKQLLAARPGDPAVLCAYVHTLAEAGLADEAAATASQALAGAGASGGCLYAAWGRALEAGADSLMAKGQVEAARQLYQKAVEPLTQGSSDPVFGKYCEAILAEVRYKESPMEELKP